MFLFQLTVVAYSVGCEQYATVEVQVTREVDQCPVFLGTPYGTTINRNQAVNETLLTILARDNVQAVGFEEDSSSYSLNLLMLVFFFI